MSLVPSVELEWNRLALVIDLMQKRRRLSQSEGFAGRIYISECVRRRRIRQLDATSSTIAAVIRSFFGSSREISQLGLYSVSSYLDRRDDTDDCKAIPSFFRRHRRHDADASNRHAYARFRSERSWSKVTARLAATDIYTRRWKPRQSRDRDKPRCSDDERFVSHSCRSFRARRRQGRHVTFVFRSETGRSTPSERRDARASP